MLFILKVSKQIFAILNFMKFWDTLVCKKKHQGKNIFPSLLKINVFMFEEPGALNVNSDDHLTSIIKTAICNSWLTQICMSHLLNNFIFNYISCALHLVLIQKGCRVISTLKNLSGIICILSV